MAIFTTWMPTVGGASRRSTTRLLRTKERHASHSSKNACGGDDELRREIESLFEAQDSAAASFLTAPPSALPAPLVAAARSIGQYIGVYEIREQIGAGGMGQVYRARDTRLGRDVAIKILPGAFSADPDRIARLEREARVLAALNHPNIATLLDVEETDGGRALVIELVEGTTLAERLSQGPLPLTEALGVARQIADALDAAHQKGIIHRDLKPANIKIAPTGLVKVLDFGLAKAMDADSARNPSQMPTVTVGATGEGLIVGTAAYMSPEQARGLAVDKRTDIWAFGCVLYEMITGRAAFARRTVSDTLAQILGSEPDWNSLSDVSPGVRRLLKRCLDKDQRRRVHDIADARIEIDDALSPSAAAMPEWPAMRGTRHWRTSAAVLGALALIAATVAIRYGALRPAAPTPRQQVRYSIPLRPGEQLPIDAGLPVSVAISPAGDQIVYAARTVSGDRLYLRRLDALDAVPIPGTEGAIGPAFSPDGQSIVFTSGGKLRAVPISGGVPRILAESPNVAGVSWGANDVVVFGNWNSGLFKVSARGGAPEPLTTLDAQQAEGEHNAPYWLPRGNAVLFTVRRRDGQFVETVEIATGNRHRVIEGRNPVYLPNGDLVFGRGTAVYAAPFDAGRLKVTGPEVRLFDGVRSDGNDTLFAAAGAGTFVYIPEALSSSRLMWVSMQGTQRPLDDERRSYNHPRISPDGTRVALTLPLEAGGSEIWIYEISGGTHVRLSLSGPVSRPVWTHDGNAVTFQMAGSLYSAPADGSGGPQLVLERNERFPQLFPLAWSRDGRVLMFSAPVPATNRDVWMRRSDGTIAPFLATPLDERAATFSPDGRWVAHAERETGREEQVYVQPYPGPGSRKVVSPGGGIEPVWSPTGREIFYRSVDGTRLMAVEIRTEPALSVGPPRQVFAGQFHKSPGSYWSDYDVSRDGQRFLMLAADEESAPRLNVVLGWDRSSRQR